LELVDAQTRIRRRKPPRKPSRQQAKQIVNLDAKKQLEAIKMGSQQPKQRKPPKNILTL